MLVEYNFREGYPKSQRNVPTHRLSIRARFVPKAFVYQVFSRHPLWLNVSASPPVAQENLSQHVACGPVARPLDVPDLHRMLWGFQGNFLLPRLCVPLS